MAFRAVRLTSILSATLATYVCFAQVFSEERQKAIERILADHPRARIAYADGGVGRVYGNLPMPGSMVDAAADFVSRYSEALGVEANNLTLTHQFEIGEGRFLAVVFAQTCFGVLVERGGVTVLVRAGSPNQIVLVCPYTKNAPAEMPMGMISPRRALDVVRKAMPHGENFSSAEFVVWTGGEQGRYAYRIEASTNDLNKPEKWDYFVDGKTGAILEKRDKIYYVDVSGTLRAWRTPGLLPDTSYNRPILDVLPGATARIVGGNSVFSSGDGTYTISNPGSTAVTVESSLVGRWVRVQNQAGANEVLSQTVTPPGPADFTFNQSQSEFTTAQVNGFIHTEIVRNFARAINPTYPGLDVQMLCNVNLANTCNAFYNGTSINFYRAGGQCPNTAYTTVVYHEYGHHMVASGHSAPSGDYHEGMSDTVATLLVNDHIVGRDFRGPGTFVRDVDNPNVQYPCSGGVHHCGLVVAGSFWDTYKELQVTMGQQAALEHIRYLAINSILLSPPVNPNLTIDVLTLDDNDGDITNGTPHYFEIDRGFRAHNLPAPPLAPFKFVIDPIDTEFLPANQANVLRIGTLPLSGEYQPGTGAINYRVNGGSWTTQPFFSITLSRVPFVILPYTATLPSGPPGTLIEWYLSGRDLNNNLVYDRDPSDPHVTILANSVTTVLNDNFETHLGWTVTNENLTDGAWERGIPAGDGTRGDPRIDADGSGRCYLTGNRPGNSDVDGGPTILTSPVFDGGANAVVRVWFWMYNDDGDDDLILQVSNNGGSTWTTVKAWRGGAGGWKQFQFPVSAFVLPTANMRIRFSIADNPNNSITEGGVDGVIIRKAS